MTNWPLPDDDLREMFYIQLMRYDGRVEDLGRISVLMNHVLEMGICDVYTGGNKDFVDYFWNLGEDDKKEKLHEFIYGLSHLKDNLSEISLIADGTDNMNDRGFRVC